jgi:cobalt/nickel transport system ATP-binding protein
LAGCIGYRRYLPADVSGHPRRLTSAIPWDRVKMNESVSSLPSVFLVNELCYSYADGFPALRSVSLSVKPGERVAILGSNGSGKSTILKILDGLYFPDYGTVLAFGNELSEAALQKDEFHFQFRSQVGFLFQDSDAQLFMPTVFEEVAFAPLQLGFSDSDVLTRVENALEALQIQSLRLRAPHQLSGGEKKRVALASILSLNPAVWLLDEPSAGLDPRSTAWLMDFLTTQDSSGRTIVMATHDLSIVEQTADRVYVLDEMHKIVEEGTPRQILSDHSLLVEANLARA